MKDKEKFGLVITTFESKDEAVSMARLLCEKGLAACVQMDRVESFYIWEKQACQTFEFRLQIKTEHALYQSIERLIKERHSYETPEIIFIPIETGSSEYLSWMQTQLGFKA